MNMNLRSVLTKLNEKFKENIKYIKRNYLLLLMLVPGLIMLVLYKLAPLGGMVIAFQNFSSFKGILNSDFAGFKYFIQMVEDPYMLTLVKNTLILAFMTLLFSFPIPIFFALMLNEVRMKRIRHMVQSLSFFPYFISAAVMVSVLYTMLSPSNGIVNQIISNLGGKPIYFVTESEWFRPLYIGLQIWQTMGYSGIIYIAAMLAIDPTLYEAASVDGANRWHKIFYITIPCIMPTIVVMLIIAVGNIFTVDLDRILLMYNSSVYDTADVIQTYVYRIGFQNQGFPNYSYGTAVNLVKSVIAFILVVWTNRLAGKFSQQRVF